MKGKLLVSILILFISWAYVFLHSHPVAWPLGSELVKPSCPTYNIKEIKRRMSYHGTLVAERELKTGEWFFYRNGEKCKLW